MIISRPVTYLIGAFVLAFVLITVIKTRQGQSDSEPVTRLSDARKTQIARFWAVYNRASDHRRAGHPDSAVVAYRDALRLNDRHEDALYYLGNTLLQLGRYDEALDAFRRLIAVNPLSTRAHFQAGAILSCTDPGAPFDLDAAEREFLRTFELNREESEPLVRLGEVAVAKEKFDLAETYLRDATRLNKKAVVAYYLLGYLQWRRGDRPEAVELFNTALSQSRSDQPTHGVPGEGDTRDGAQLGEGRQSLFTPLVQTAMDGLPHRSDARIDDAYRQLARFCEKVSERWRMRG